MPGRSRAAKFRASMGGKKVKATSRTFEFANVNSAKSYAKAARSLSSTLSVALQNGNRVTLSTNNPKDMRRATVLANATIRGTVKASQTISASIKAQKRQDYETRLPPALSDAELIKLGVTFVPSPSSTDDGSRYVIGYITGGTPGSPVYGYMQTVPKTTKGEGALKSQYDALYRIAQDANKRAAKLRASGKIKASQTVSASSSFSITCESPGRARNLALALMKIDGAKVTTNGSKVQASYDAKHTGKVLLSAANVHQRSVAAAGATADPSNLKYMFKSEAAASKFVDSVLRMGKGLKAAYKGNGAVVLRPGNYAAEISDLAKQSGGKPAGGVVGASIKAAKSTDESLFPKTRVKPITITVKSSGKSKMGPMSAAEVATWIADEIVEDPSTFGKATANGNVVTVTGAKKSKITEIAKRESYGAKIEINASNASALRLSRRAKFELSQATIAAAATSKDLLLICRFKEPSAAEEFVDDVEKAFPKISADYENRLTVSLVLENPSSSDASKIQTMARKYDGLVKRIGK